MKRLLLAPLRLAGAVLLGCIAVALWALDLLWNGWGKPGVRL